MLKKREYIWMYDPNWDLEHYNWIYQMNIKIMNFFYITLLNALENPM
jgi:hypothetical protein